jgi:hypothetical protein
MNPKLPYTATTKSHWPAVEQWCVANIGAWNEEWYREHADLAEYIENSNVQETYYFQTGEQATLFALRWS